HKYVDKSIYDIEYLQEHEKQQQQVSQSQQIQKEVDLMAEIENEVKQAQLLTETVQDKTLSNNRKVKGIRDNRAFEKEKRREGEAFELDLNKSSTSVESTKELENIKPKTPPGKTKSDKSLKRKNLKLLRKMRIERSIEED
ncbi:MAG: DNA-binding protein, partial [Cyanobacteria bacterium P01_A01_bin.83]